VFLLKLNILDKKLNSMENKMKTYIKLIIVPALVSSICACSTWDKLDKTEKGAVIGTGTGAVIGGASGSTTGAVVGGAAGGLAGGVIGHQVERDDRRHHY
jgi:uncharacterized protein YcfJ